MLFCPAHINAECHLETQEKEQDTSCNLKTREGDTKGIEEKKS